MKFNLKNSVIDYIVIGSLIIASGIFTALFYLNDEEGASVLPQWKDNNFKFERR